MSSLVFLWSVGKSEAAVEAEANIDHYLILFVSCLLHMDTGHALVSEVMPMVQSDILPGRYRDHPSHPPFLPPLQSVSPFIFTFLFLFLRRLSVHLIPSPLCDNNVHVMVCLTNFFFLFVLSDLIPWPGRVWDLGEISRSRWSEWSEWSVVSPHKQK